jgi:IS5 family transposase
MDVFDTPEQIPASVYTGARGARRRNAEQPRRRAGMNKATVIAQSRLSDDSRMDIAATRLLGSLVAARCRL